MPSNSVSILSLKESSIPLDDLEEHVVSIEQRSESAETDSGKWTSYQYVGRTGSVIPTASLAGADVSVDLLLLLLGIIHHLFTALWLVHMNKLLFIKVRMVMIMAEIELNSREETWTASSFEKLGKLVYLHAAISETLRLYPSVPIDHKCAVKWDTLPSGHYVDQNTMVFYSIYSLGKMEDIWGKDCLEFKPERWISDKGQIVHITSCKFMVFNAGPRSCLGRSMSFTKMKMVATAILCNYHVQVMEAHPISPCSSVVLHMKHGLKVRVTKRCT
ncbi:hypothetical protein L6164_000593 [Bauhinia variegata]|uniref:Uncharacterized protein n=1 Tax=Bauhinia variegata TaxID=167791 RepID=A0ACB9Q6Y8_BAUVA|nr:hypothetical protein L6164_000593 [Bauhinia variegata]